MIHKTTRSILSVLLAVLLLVTSTPLTPAFAGEGGTVSPQSASGEGRALEPAADGVYYISTAEQLKEFADKVNDTSGQYTDIDAELTADIDLNNQPWYPIGSDSRPYSGTFDGNGHTISGLNINNSTADDQGLFGYVSGTVQNLTVDGTVSGSGNYVGGVVGYNSSGTVTNCAFSGSVSGNNSVGGVVGDNGSSASVENCYNTGAVSGGEDVGGVVGYNDSGIVENCYNIGKVTGSADSSNVGGVVGQNSDSSSVTNCYNTGAVNSSGNRVGGVVGDNSGIVTNCYNTGSVSGPDIGDSNRVGGVVGYNHIGGNVTNCYNTGTVTGPESGNNNRVGGVVGWNTGRVENCYNTGTVTGPDSGTSNYVGGVVGLNSSDYSSASASVTNCYNTGTVSGPDSGSGNSVGGVVGSNSFSTTVTNCYNTGTVTGPVSASGNNSVRVGGVVGSNSFSASVTNCYNTGEVSGLDSGSDSNVGGVVGQNFDGNVTGCYFLKGTAGSGIGEGSGDATNLTTDEFKNTDNFTNWDFDNTWRISQSLNLPVLQANAEDNALSGTGKQEDPYKIYRAIDLKNFRDLVNDANDQTADPDAHAKLMNNIDLSSVCGPTLDSEQPVSWTPIGNSFSNSYSGTFNGNGKTISGLYINDSTADYQGLFGYVGSSGTVKDLTVSGNVSGSNSVGGVVGLNSGNVENCYNTGTVTGTDDYVGGVVGQNRGSVTNCYNTGTGTVTGSSDYVGGVVGYNNEGRVENCHNIGEVSGNRYVGGVVGDNSSGSVENCYNTGVVSGGEYVGGVVGYNHIGGSVTNSYNTGAVSGLDSGTGNRVGGVVGDNVSSTVENCYNTGTVRGNQVGGVVGLNGGIVENCYNTGSVTSSDSPVGGVVGYNDSGTVTDCYFLQQDPAIYGIGNTTKDDISQTAAKSLEDFQSGEVAYLLQSKQTDESGLVWGQSALGTEDSLPTLVALNPDAAKEVYQLTFDWRYEGASEGTATTTNVYTNGSVAIPEINHDRAGYHISGWKDASGAPVTTETAVTADTIYTAEWAANTYTITVTAGSGGAVSGGGTFAEGTQVTVTATANDGYTFVAWQENSTKIEGAGASYTFTVNGNRSLTAIFEKEPEPTPTPDPTPSGPSTGDSSGWDDIRDELENAENGDEITIDMGDETKVPAEIFESLAGKDVEISFDLGDIQWSVNGADIPTDTDFTDLDLGVNLDTHGIPVNVINTITGEVGTVQITLAHNGEFGFTMTLSAPLGKENAGYWANLYHYDEDAEALNFEAAAKVDEDGSVTIPFSHASQYAIVIDTHSHAAVDVSDLFIDIAPDAWYKDAVQYAYDQGLMTGVSDTEFAPEATTTRAMIVSILARLENVTTAEAAGFADVDDEWYATAVNWAANVGVVNGYEDNTFRPNTAITREQLAAILMNYAAYKGEDVSNRADLTTYTDQPSTWAQEAMSWAVAEGLISGVTNDQLQPQSSATRAQVAAILQRLLEA